MVVPRAVAAYGRQLKIFCSRISHSLTKIMCFCSVVADRGLAAQVRRKALCVTFYSIKGVDV